MMESGSVQQRWQALHALTARHDISRVRVTGSHRSRGAEAAVYQSVRFGVNAHMRQPVGVFHGLSEENRGRSHDRWRPGLHRRRPGNGRRERRYTVTPSGGPYVLLRRIPVGQLGLWTVRPGLWTWRRLGRRTRRLWTRRLWTRRLWTRRLWTRRLRTRLRTRL